MQWHIQADNTITNIKVQLDFTFPTLNAKDVVV